MTKPNTAPGPIVRCAPVVVSGPYGWSRGVCCEVSPSTGEALVRLDFYDEDDEQQEGWYGLVAVELDIDDPIGRMIANMEQA